MGIMRMWGWGRTGGTACLHRSDELHSFSEQGSLLNSYHSPNLLLVLTANGNRIYGPRTVVVLCPR